MHAAIVRLSARAELDAATDTALLEAREQALNGDEDLQWLLQQREAGMILLVCLDVTACAVRDDGTVEEVSVANRGVWLERDAVPHVEAQVSQTATKDFSRLTLALRQRAAYVGPRAFDGMYIHVELDDSLRAVLPCGRGQAAGADV